MNKVTEKVNSKLNTFEIVESTEQVAKYIGTNFNYTHKIKWFNAITILIIHILYLWALVLIFQGKVQKETTLWTFFIALFSNIGNSVGCHRLYCHKSFKAKPVLEVILIALQTISGQNSIFTWVRDHRLHHRYSDTDADPHNSKRGVLFCSLGWIIIKRNKYVQELGKKIDMTDLQVNKFVMFQKRHYKPLYWLLGVFIPVFVPVYFFNEKWWRSLLVAYFLRYTVLLHYTAIVVTLGHNLGTRPYDKNIQPTDSRFVSIISFGEGSHNFHHVFPWDYKTEEGPNAMSIFIWACEKLGLAYDLKTASPEVVKNRVIRTGDGTHHVFGTDEAKSIVTTRGPLHRWNPTYRSTKVPDVITRIVGPKDLFTTDLEKSG